MGPRLSGTSNRNMQQCMVLRRSHVLSFQRCIMYKCDRFEQKQADGCVLTNPLNATPLRPGSTFIDEIFKIDTSKDSC